MAEWGYLLSHLNDYRYMPYSVFREEAIRAETAEVARKGIEIRIPLLVDVVLAALDYAGDDTGLNEALIAAGYLPVEEDEEDD